MTAWLCAVVLALSVWSQEFPTQPVQHTVQEARAYALEQLGVDQYNCLDRLVQRESRWNPRSTNRASGAYGLPQALPGRKMASAGYDWRTNPVTQIKWAIRYMRRRYGSPCEALAHSDRTGWY